MSRPTVMTEVVLQKLEYAFSIGCTDREACCHAGISKGTLYNYCKENEEFLDQKETLKEAPYVKARQVLLKALDGSDINTAHKMIDRKEGSKVNVDHSNTDGTLRPTTINIVAEPVNDISHH